MNNIKDRKSKMRARRKQVQPAKNRRRIQKGDNKLEASERGKGMGTELLCLNSSEKERKGAKSQQGSKQVLEGENMPHRHC